MIINEVGKTYGLWTVFQFSHQNQRNEAYWDCECQCDDGHCKRRRAVIGSDLRAGKSTQCGMRRRWGPKRLQQEAIIQEIESLLKRAVELVGKRRV